jgi:hypothetical protein
MAEARCAMNNSVPPYRTGGTGMYGGDIRATLMDVHGIEAAHTSAETLRRLSGFFRTDADERD